MTTIRQWPAKGAVPATDLLLPVEAAIRRTHQICYMSGSDPDYHGYDIGEQEQSVGLCISPSQLTTERIEQIALEDGRTPLMSWLLIAFQLGIEQGRKMIAEEDRR